MHCSLPYGDGYLKLELPGLNTGRILEGKELPPSRAEEELVREALSEPTGSPPLSSLVQRGERVAIIAGDMTRLWARYHILLPELLDELNRGGVDDGASLSFRPRDTTASRARRSTGCSWARRSTPGCPFTITAPTTGKSCFTWAIRIPAPPSG